MKTGLILEGGAMRGMFTAGVIDVMMENGIEYDGAIGVSAGAVFGCNYKSRQIGRVIRYNTTFCRNWRYVSLRSLIFTGDLYGAKFCYEDLPDRLDIFDTDTYEKTPMEFWVVCTDVHTGEAIYHRCDDGGYEDVQWMRASASMPVVSRVVNLGGYHMLDGGIVDSIPIKKFQEMGYDRNVIVLTQPLDYVKKKSKYMGLLKVPLRKYPKIFQALMRRHEDYNEIIAYIRELEEKKDVYVIRPEQPLGIGAVERDPDKLRAVYEIGRQTALKHLDELRAFLEKQ